MKTTITKITCDSCKNDMPREAKWINFGSNETKDYCSKECFCAILSTVEVDARYDFKKGDRVQECVSCSKLFATDEDGVSVSGNHLTNGEWIKYPYVCSSECLINIFTK